MLPSRSLSRQDLVDVVCVQPSDVNLALIRFCDDYQNLLKTRPYLRVHDHIGSLSLRSGNILGATKQITMAQSLCKKRVRVDAVVSIIDLSHSPAMDACRSVSISTPLKKKSDPEFNGLDVREVDFTGTGGECCYCQVSDDTVTWLFWLKKHLCLTCRHLPEFKTICRSQAMKKFGLTFDQLIQAEADGSLQVMYTRNPRNTGVNAGKDQKSKWMKLMYETDVRAHAEYLRSCSK